MSSDPEQEFFSDGITEDIITALSKVSALMVIARNSTFVYKGKSIDIKQVGRDQGVRYVLEGSVRKFGKRVRITAQLIDATTGLHKWAERYDSDLEDIFALQDEITVKIVTALDIHLLKGEQAQLWSSSTKNLQAWECFRLARDLMDGYRAEDVPEVKRLLHNALELDPEYAAAWTSLSGVHFHVEEDARYSSEVRAQALELSRECAEAAIKFDPSCASAYSGLALYYLAIKEFDEATYNAKKAVELEPNHASVLAVSAIILNKSDQPERAIEHIRRAMRLCPVYPMWFLSTLGQVCRVLGRMEDAIKAYTEMVEHSPDNLEAHIGRTEILAEAGRTNEAITSAAEVLRVNPDFSISEYMDNLSFRDPTQIARFETGLRAAGLPE